MDNDIRTIPAPGEFYRHFKGNLYQVIAVAQNTETREELVIYQALYGSFGIYARPIDMFMSEVDHNKYPDVKEKYRFTKVSLNPEKETIRNESVKEETASENARPHFELQEADELFHEFLDTDVFTEKRNILRAGGNKFTRNMVNTIAISLDLIPEGKDIDEDIRRIDEYLTTRIRFEGRASDKR